MQAALAALSLHSLFTGQHLCCFSYHLLNDKPPETQGLKTTAASLPAILCWGVWAGLYEKLKSSLTWCRWGGSVLIHGASLFPCDHSPFTVWPEFLNWQLALERVQMKAGGPLRARLRGSTSSLLPYPVGQASPQQPCVREEINSTLDGGWHTDTGGRCWEPQHLPVLQTVSRGLLIMPFLYMPAYVLPSPCQHRACIHVSSGQSTG